MKFPCPKCSQLCEGERRSENQTLSGERVQYFQCRCKEHGVFPAQYQDHAFVKTRVNVHLTDRDTVLCPSCDVECAAVVCAAVVTYRSQELGGPTLLLIDAECPTHGLFKSREEIPSAER